MGRSDPNGAASPTRLSGPSRRQLLNGAGVAIVGATAGASLPIGGTTSGGFGSAAHAQTAAPAVAAGPQALTFPGKNAGLTLLGDRPLVAETPESLLDDDTTPLDKFFIRNNGQLPDPIADADAWTLTVEGEVNTPLTISVAQLKSRFPSKTYRMVLECGGNGRSFFAPQARGNPWTNGGVGCAEWTGVSLVDVLQSIGLKGNAKYTAHYGADLHLSGDTGKETLSRGMPIEKALEPHCLIVHAMNGQPLPNIHGGPLRLVIPGWPGSLSHKWLKRIVIRDREHDGQGMTGTSYRVPIRPMVPGGKTDDANMRILESMPVRSILTSPGNGARIAKDARELSLRGAAWAGDLTVSKVDVSIDSGATWTSAQVAAPKNRYDWQRWTAKVRLPSDGYFEIWSRATDSQGRMQPHVASNWNPQGYGGNALHRIAILVG